MAATAAFDRQEVLDAILLPELRMIAKARMRHERPDHTLQPTELVNELYLRLLRRPDCVWKSRHHFLVSASQAMRHFLVDYAREKQAEKRGGLFTHLELTEASQVSAPGSELILLMDTALEELAKTEPRMCQVVELHFFGGLTFSEIGSALDVNERTAKRDWTLAKRWLADHLGKADGDESGRVGKH